MKKTAYQKAMSKVNQLLQRQKSWLNFKLIRSIPDRHGQYDPQSKTIRINRHKTKKKTYVGLVLHQFAHAMQDKRGYFDRKKNLAKGQQLQYLIRKHKKKYVHGYHYKYVKPVIKMQYDRQKRAYRLIRRYKALRSFISPQEYITDANLYILIIKYKFITGRARMLNRQYEQVRPIIRDRVMNNKQLLRPLTQGQFNFLDNIRE